MAAGSIEIIQLFHARAPVIGYALPRNTTLQQAPSGLSLSNFTRDIMTLLQANFSLTRLISTSEKKSKKNLIKK